MAVSGTYNFNLDIDEVIQEATEMIGGEDTLGHEPASARRSINLMLKDWQNRGILLWTTSTTTVTLATSVTSYDLASAQLMLWKLYIVEIIQISSLLVLLLKNILLFQHQHRQVGLPSIALDGVEIILQYLFGLYLRTLQIH